MSRSRDPGFDVSYLDLFAIGITDSGRKLFYSMGTACEIAEARAVLDHGMGGFGVGGEEQEFCGQFVKFLVSQNLIQYDFTDFLIDWEDRQLQPTFLCPLSPRGRMLLDQLRRLAGEDRSSFSGSPIGLMDEVLQCRLPTNLEKWRALRERILQPTNPPA